MNEQRDDETLLDHRRLPLCVAARSSHVAPADCDADGRAAPILRMIGAERAPTAAYLLRSLTPSAISAPFTVRTK